MIHLHDRYALDGMKRKTGVDAYIREIEYIERTGADPFEVLK
jgi:hypothetical protein